MLAELKTAQLQTIPASEGIGEQSVVVCPTCDSNVILFSRTIQTYCWKCGVAVTQLGKSGMYYELPEPNSAATE
jgi:hypothetical protein